MVPYYSREYRSTSIGVRIVEVTCEKCAAVYFYELARVGKGAVSAPYAIGSDTAAQKSTDLAEANLNQRLTDESELVPCPKCFWINEELVTGYRRGQYRGWTKFALGVGFFGTLISLLMAWFLSQGPQADRAALPYFLYYGPAISIGLSIPLFLRGRWLKSRIKPNDAFPLAPRLPPGSPKALIENPTTGELEPAPPMIGQETSDDWLDFQVGRSVLPPVCAECLGPPDEKSSYEQPLDQSVTLVVPRCAECEDRAEKTRLKLGLIWMAITAVVLISILWVLNLEAIFFWCGGVLALMLGYGVGMVHGDLLTTPVRIEFVDDSRGIVRLQFRNQEYRKLIESSTDFKP